MAALYDIPVKSIDGKDTSLGAYKGDVLLVVNVASACGLTPQYTALEQVFEKYRDKGFKVVGFPANNFGAQEPGTNDEIKTFCESKFNVQFPMFAKISVKGDDQHPLYKQLISEKPTAAHNENGQLLETLTKYGMAPTNKTDVMWNFEKFLVGRDGKVVGRFAPDITPDDPKVTAAIEGALG